MDPEGFMMMMMMMMMIRELFCRFSLKSYAVEASLSYLPCKPRIMSSVPGFLSLSDET